MTAFFKRYKGAILYWTILLFLPLYFAPGQNQYYLQQDIDKFKTVYLIPTFIWTFGLLTVGLLMFWLIKTKSIKQSIGWFLSTVLTLAFIIFIFQSIFLGIALFANRQITKKKIVRTYQASFMSGTELSKNNFFPHELSTKQI